MKGEGITVVCWEGHVWDVWEMHTYVPFDEE